MGAIWYTVYIGVKLRLHRYFRWKIVKNGRYKRKWGRNTPDNLRVYYKLNVQFTIAHFNEWLSIWVMQALVESQLWRKYLNWTKLKEYSSIRFLNQNRHRFMRQDLTHQINDLFRLFGLACVTSTYLIQQLFHLIYYHKAIAQKENKKLQKETTECKRNNSLETISFVMWTKWDMYKVSW